MKIGVISDTHIPAAASGIPPRILASFKDCDLIIHAGDIVEKQVIRELEKIAETRVVRGNMDSTELKRILPEKIVFNVCGKSIGVTHGSGHPAKVVRTVARMFRKKPDIIIFGHTHTPFNETVNGTLFFNPGSATDSFFAPYRSFGIIRIEGDDVSAEIIRLDDRRE